MFTNVPPLSKILNKRTLIIGELGSGKTLLTMKIVDKLVDNGYGKYITILDLAPKRKGIIGGRLIDFGFNSSKVFAYLAPKKVFTPRIAANNAEELLKLAIMNRNNMQPLIYRYLDAPTEILVINDLTLYLHVGSLDLIDECIMVSETFIANAYYGDELSFDYGTGISLREKTMVLELIRYMDNVIVMKKR